MAGLKVLVTGGSGFIGTNIIEHYLSKGFHILNIDIKAPRNNDHHHLWRQADIRDFHKLKNLVTDFKPEFVLHLAARADLTGKSLQDYSSNIIGVENLIKVCNETSSIKKVIFTSTQLVCRVGYVPSGDTDYCPPNLYGESKMIGEKLVRDASDLLQFDWVIIRPTSIWGPWFGPTYRRFFELIIRKRYFNFSGTLSTKTYGYIGNAVYQIDELLKSDSDNRRTFYIGDYQPVNIKEWAAEIGRELNYSIISIPRPIIWLAAKFGDIFSCLNIKFPINSFRYKNMTTDNIVPLEETKIIAPDTLFSRAEGNRLTIKWMQEYYLK